MLIFTCSGFNPTTPATAAWSTVWNCSPFHTSHEFAESFTTQFIGSIAACARYGNSYDASITFAAPVNAFSASPSLRATGAGFAASLRYSSKSSVDEYVTALLSSHSILSASRAFFADQKLVAT